MCRPVQMGFKANFHVKNSARFRKSLRLTRADRSVWQARVSRAPPLTQRQDGSVQMCNKTAPAGILLLLFSFMPRGDDMETKGSVCSVLSTRGNMAHYTCRCSNYTNFPQKKERGKKKKIVSFLFFLFFAVPFIKCVSSVVRKTAGGSSAIHHQLTFRLIFLLRLCVWVCVRRYSQTSMCVCGGGGE